MIAENIQCIPSQPEQIIALRDFFASKNSNDLKNACGKLGLPRDAHATNWRDVEYAFNRLFVGPMAVHAPPYASVYLEPEAKCMGQTTLEVRALYGELGLAAPNLGGNGVLPDDHIALELDAVLALLTVEDWSRRFDRQNAIGDESRMHLSWLANHMGAWVPQFYEKVQQYYGKNTTEDETQGIIIPIMSILNRSVHDLCATYVIKECVNA